MGIESWGNPVCNRRVRVVNVDHPERSVVARIVDKCPGDECAWGSLDLSPYAFKKLGHLDTGILNISWNYI
jgi:expansin (peptidoglycan-binding protein)